MLRLSSFFVILGFLIGSTHCAPARDCTASCLFASTYKIWQNHTLSAVYLPQTFDLSFDFQLGEIPGPLDGTILSMAPIGGLDLLSVSIKAGTNFVKVHYQGVPYLDNGPSVNLASNQWTTITVSLAFDSVSVSIGSNSQSVKFNDKTASPGVLSNLFISNPAEQAVIGNIRRIKITGPLCCAQTSYYQTNWQTCGNAADYTTANPVQSCGTCLSYSCIDWVVGSAAMVQREQDFLRETNESVTFAVGSFGNDNSRAGLCYRITSDQATQDIIAQVISLSSNTNNFNIMLGAGGLGAEDSCLLGYGEANGPTAPMFYGEPPSWGNFDGGITDKGSCVSANAQPICRPNAPDNMQALCEASFDRFLRLGTGNTNNSSPRIHSICPVKCPRQLYTATGLHRLDEPSDSFVCPANQTLTTANRLQRYFDCQRPDFADAANINGTVDPLYKIVIPCRRDGYSRINGLPPVPTLNPTPEPTPVPSFEPTPVPTMDNMCCLTTDYSSAYWQGCHDAADPNLGSISSCDNCAAYSCLDWLPGSTDMATREKAFYSHTLDNVYFGVGSFGADKGQGGLCYRITTNTLDRDIIMQVVTTDSGDGNVHLMSADGGIGLQNACTLEGSSIPMFMSTEADWGDIFKGVNIRDQCSALPEGPYCSLNPRDNVQDLCRWAFDSGLRVPSLSDANPKVIHMCEVACPMELFSATGVARVDRNLTEPTCVTSSVTKITASTELARYMDCAKPQFAWGTILGKTDPNYPIVVPCRRDGYARVNVVPTMPPTTFPSYMPTPSNEPTSVETGTPSMGNSVAPTVRRTSSIPTIVPSFSPSLNSLCCADQVYQDSVWPSCNNAADKTIKSVTSCSTCMSYQCLDWNALSNGMKAREAAYYAEAGDQVYFGVGSYGSDLSKAGLCYRLNVAGVDRDLIVQVITEGTVGPAGNFNLMMSDGGLGEDNNACTASGSALPQFVGNSSIWGGPKGGWVNASGCNNIPEYPFCSGVRQDNMRTLCQQSFAVGLRIPNNVTHSNPRIKKMCQVKCPRSLWQATGLHRSDESSKSYQCSAALEPPGGTLSRSMNCAKPSYAWSGNIVGSTFNGSSAVVPCRRDGYTRINSKPSAMPTLTPTVSPTKNNTLCCSSTPYADYQWPYCKNPADTKLTSVPSCAAEDCVSYQCIDWNVLSSGMTQRAQSYYKQNKESVYFGVGSYGSDPTRAGLCYRITTAEINKDIIVQVITQGGNTPDGYFNLMMADGGFSDQYTACARSGSVVPMYSGSSAQWGGKNGGWADITGCDSVPQYPICSSVKYDNMRQLCRATFQNNFRLANISDSQPHITNMCQVACPSQLWQATGLRRADEGTKSFKCGANVEPSGGLLSRSMDCAKPTYAWGPIKGLTYNGSSLVVPCRRDGYTRINTVASSQPTTTPTIRPTRTPKPTVVVTAAPSIDPLCCPYQSYADLATWQTCNNAASPSLGRVGSCKTCLSYQCIDWTAGSRAMKARQATFLNRTGLNVHFGVGSYSNDPTRGGNCYRLSVQGVKLDLIVQSINQGAPAADGNFEMLLGDGGFTGNQACIIGSGANVPMYPGNASMWGQNYGYSGGWNSYFGCNNLPRYPICGGDPQDDLRDLCKWSFSNGLRFVSGRPYITSMCQVACPVELYSATGIHRLDEPTTSYACGTVISGGGNLNRMMDCGKPSFAWKGSAKGRLDPQYPMVVPCKRDGYSRINELPVYPPTEEPSIAPTYTAVPTPPSTIKPTMRPSNATIVSAQAKPNPLFAMLSGTKNLSIASAVLFVILLLLIVSACEFSLRRTRHRQLLERVEEKRKLIAESNTQRRAELLQQLNAPTPLSSAIELRRSYSAYQKINRTLLSNDQTDIVM